MNRETIVKYVRDNKRNLRGVVVATKVGDKQYSIGWSLCRSEDTFNKRVGLNIAIGRAKSQVVHSLLPKSLYSDFEGVLDRAARYFKGCTCV